MRGARYPTSRNPAIGIRRCGHVAQRSASDVEATSRPTCRKPSLLFDRPPPPAARTPVGAPPPPCQRARRATRRFRSTRGDRHPTSRNPAIGIRRCGPPLLDAWHQRSRPHLTQAVTQSTSDVPARGCSEPGSLHIVPRAWRVLPAHFSQEGVFPPDTGCSEPGIPHIVP